MCTFALANSFFLRKNINDYLGLRVPLFSRALNDRTVSRDSKQATVKVSIEINAS